MAERRTRQAVALATVAVAAILITSCAGIPAEGPVVAASPIPSASSEVRIDLPSAPRPGSTQEEIVEGFLEAMSEYQPGYILAEQYLTEDARDGWGEGAIQVYRTWTTEVSPPSIVRLYYDRVAQIDASGHYSTVPVGEPQQSVLRLEQDEDGEWRIDTPPDFLLISDFDLPRSYAPFSTYFPNPAGDVLVPDQVWLPTAEPQLPSLLAQAVVLPPTGILGPSGAVSAFPEGTSVTSAEVSGPVVTVSVTGANLESTDAAARRLMAAQLTATLSQLPGVQRADLAIGDEVVDVPDVATDLDALAGFSAPPMFLLTDNNAVLVDPTAASAFVAVPGPLGRGEVPARSLAVSLDRTVAATVSEAGNEVFQTPLTDDGVPVPVFSGNDIAPPSYDRYGNLWLVDRLADNRTSVVKMIDPDGGVHDVGAPDLTEGRVSDLRIAPDGVRVAAVTEGVGAALRLGHVIRGEALQIDLIEEVHFDTTVSDVVWAGTNELVVVVKAPDGLLRPYTVDVDGSAVAAGTVSGITALAAFKDRPTYALTDVRNVLIQESVLDWDQVRETTEFVTYPG